MTEKEWLKCVDPIEMGDHLGDLRQWGGRKLRLFGCACVRDVWEDLPDDVLREAIVTCEQFTGGLATAKELKKARDLANGTYQGIGDIVADHSALAITALCEKNPDFLMGTGSQGGIAAVAAEAKSNRRTPFHLALKRTQKLHSQLLRDVFGNPFRPVVFDPEWRTPTVMQLAQQMHESRDFSTMPILADALQDAGCTSAEILAHCRDESIIHVRGCWVIDLVLGKK
jgi:hypothetical protein